MLVCIAGTDGSGKSTLVSNLQKSLELELKCKQLRLYETVLCSTWQKRAALQLLRNGIEPTHYNLVMAYLMFELEEKSYSNLMKAKQENDIIILDRYLETIDFIALNYKVEQRLLTSVLDKFEKPDLYIYLKVRPQVCYERITTLRTPGDGEELNEIEAAANYYDRNKGKYAFHVMDGEQSIKDLHRSCLAIIKNAYQRMQS